MKAFKGDMIMFGELGEFLGWLIIISFILTTLNYVVKVVNKKYGKMISKYPILKKGYGMFMKIIVRKHKLFGFLTIVFILTHFLLQFSKFGLSVTGLLAALVMLLQVLMGIYGAYIYKKRLGAWFIAHRLIAVILIFVIGIHIII